MNLNSIGLILIRLIILAIIVSSNDNYFDKSIFKQLIKKNGQMKATIDWIKNRSNITIYEKYNYGLNVGNILEIMYTKDRKSFYFKSEVFYIIKTKELYLPVNQKLCFNFNLNRTITRNYYLQWAHEIVYNSKLDYKNMGPTALFDVLIETYNKNRKNVDCTNRNEKVKKCAINFKDKVRLEYYMGKKNDGTTMIPLAISLLEKIDKKWKIVHEFVYEQFTTSFVGDVVINKNLPIGIGCKRLNSSKYPRIYQQNWGIRFKIKYDVEFNHYQVKNNAIEAHNKYNFKNMSKRIYLNNQMYLNFKKSPHIVVDTISESNNQPIRLVYNSSLLFDFNLKDNQCIAYKLTDRSTNWFYINEQFLLKPQVMIGFGRDWSFIGEFNISKIKSYVFEKHFRLDNIKKIKSNYSSSIYLNRNQIFPSAITATHYYAKDIRYWGSKSTNVLVPFKIEIHFFDDTYMLGEIGNLTIKIRSFDPDPKEIPKYDINKCKVNIIKKS